MVDNAYTMMKELKEYAKENNVPIMHEEGIDFLTTFVIKYQVENVLEIGTAIGYSSAIFSEYLEDGGQIDTLEISHKAVLLAKANHKMLGVEDKINIIEGDALELLPMLQEKYDVIFIDGPKSHYIQYLHFRLLYYFLMLIVYLFYIMRMNIL